MIDKANRPAIAILTLPRFTVRSACNLPAAASITKLVVIWHFEDLAVFNRDSRAFSLKIRLCEEDDITRWTRYCSGGYSYDTSHGWEENGFKSHVGSMIVVSVLLSVHLQEILVRNRLE